MRLSGAGGELPPLKDVQGRQSLRLSGHEPEEGDDERECRENEEEREGEDGGSEQWERRASAQEVGGLLGRLLSQTPRDAMDQSGVGGREGSMKGRGSWAVQPTESMESMSRSEPHHYRWLCDSMRMPDRALRDPGRFIS